jgi:hypothetical protein
VQDGGDHKAWPKLNHLKQSRIWPNQSRRYQIGLHRPGGTPSVDGGDCSALWAQSPDWTPKVMELR